MQTILKLSAFLLVILLSSCNDGKVNFFTVDQDIQFGRDVVEEIKANPEQYPILDRNEFPEAYAHIERVRDNILKSSQLRYADRFDWDVYIINDDVLNAFALPGGTTFYYTGLIKFLDDEASLAGVMAHEIAHSDRRHSTNRLTKQYGYSVLLSFILGNNPSIAAQVAGQLAMGLGTLAFSREDEYEADEYAVRYLSDTDYDPRGVAYFFIKMDPDETPKAMTYLSTHPSPLDRIEKIMQNHVKYGGKEGDRFESRYQDFKNSLP